MQRKRSGFVPKATTAPSTISARRLSPLRCSPVSGSGSSGTTRLPAPWVRFASPFPPRLPTTCTLAYALPYEGTHIVIFYDRAQAAMPDPEGVAQLLAHVLAHEVTHVLEGVSRHSAEGV